MQIKLLVSAAAIALVAGVGSVSGNELNVADTAVGMGSAHAAEQFTTLEGIASQPLTAGDMAAVRGSKDFTVMMGPGCGIVCGLRGQSFPTTNISDDTLITPGHTVDFR